MTRIPDTSGDTADIANMVQRGIPRYHDGFSFRVPRRNAIPPHSEMHAKKEESVSQYSCSTPVVFTRNPGTRSQTGSRRA
jgi:hypothetical protein